MNRNGVRRRRPEWAPEKIRRNVILVLRRVVICADGAILMALVVGWRDVIGYAGVLSTTLRCVADLLDVPHQ